MNFFVKLKLKLLLILFLFFNLRVRVEKAANKSSAYMETIVLNVMHLMKLS